MTNSTEPVDFRRLRAERAAAVVNGEAPDTVDWLDEWGGLHTLDDGHPSSYDHDALAGVDGDAVTLTCQCGTWTGYAPSAEGDAEGLLTEWRTHVLEATGRGQADDQAAATAEAVNEDASAAARPDATDALLDTIERLRGALRASSAFADSLTDIGHVVMDMLDEARADRTRLEDEVEQLRGELAAARAGALIAGGAA